MTLVLNAAHSEFDGSTARSTALATAAALLALTAPTLIALAADGRTLNGAPIWLKPLHFQLALAVQFGTLVLLMPLLSHRWATSRMVGWSISAAGLAALLEIAYIMTQAARGRASHFNVATPLEAALYPLAGVGSLVLVSSTLLFGVALWRSPAGPGSRGLHHGAVLGLIGGSLMTLVAAGYMSAGHSHLVGGPQTDAFGLPFLGWSTKSGDLRVPHFFATHAMQALPLAGLIADRLVGPRMTWLAPALAAVYFAGVIGLFAETLLGIPFLAI